MTDFPTLLLTACVAAIGLAVAALRRLQTERSKRLAEERSLRVALLDERHRRERLEDQIARQQSVLPVVLFDLERTADGRWCVTNLGSDMPGVCLEARPTPAELWPGLDPAAAEPINRGLGEAVAAGRPWQHHFRIRAAAAEWTWIEARFVPPSEADGTRAWHGYMRVLGAGSAEHFPAVGAAEVLGAISSPVCVLVQAGESYRFEAVSPAFARLAGADVDGLASGDLAEWGARIGPEFASVVRQAAETARPFAGDLLRSGPGGAARQQLHVVPLPDRSGRLRRLVGEVREGEGPGAETGSLQLLSERLQLAAEAAQLGIWELAYASGALRWDRQMCSLFGVAEGEPPASLAAWVGLVHGRDAARFERDVRQAIEQGGPLATTFRAMGPEGELRHLRACGKVKLDEKGRPVMLVGVTWDITTEKRAKREVEEARDAAERLNAQLEAALAHAHQLAQEAAAATVAKSEFLANMSHEIRTPLNAVVGMGGLLLDTELTPEQRELAETVRTSSDSLLGLINDILDYSKIESGQLELERRPFQVRDWVESSADVLAARFAEKRLDLVLRFDAGVATTLVGDDGRLRQVLVNLLSNAVKFTARGEVEVSVATELVAEGRVRLAVTVRDTGVGIPADRMDRLFRTFSQVDASTTRLYGGTGLGLAISRRIVEQMGGMIRAESEPGRGSVFRFEVELEAVPPLGAAVPPPLAVRRVLVVEDNAAARAALVAACRDCGVEAVAVAGTTELSAKVTADLPIDAAVVDGELDGEVPWSAVEVLRRLRPEGTIPIVGLAGPGAAKPPEALQVAGIVTKPLKLAVLRAALHNVKPSGPRPDARAPAQGNLAGRFPLRILLAEDNPVNQRVAVLTLKRLGYTVDVAVNGVEAVAAVGKTDYDLVLMDVQMPEMDGLRATRRICAEVPEQRRPRIVAMTANASDNDRAQCLAAGMADFLPKPVRNEELERVLMETARLARRTKPV